MCNNNEAYSLEFRSIGNNVNRYIEKENKWEKVKSLNNTVFYVKPYQRGFRWNDNNIKKLFADIDTYSIYMREQYNTLITDMMGEKIGSNTNKYDFYCLQTLTVSRISESAFELIDGQQRLTSLFLLFEILSVFSGLKNPCPYKIVYDRSGNVDNTYHITDEIHAVLPRDVNGYDAPSAFEAYKNHELVDDTWFENYKKALSESMDSLIKNSSGMITIDLYYIQSALESIVDYLVDHSSIDIRGTLDTVRNNLFFIWYEVDNISPYDTFISINSNQIRLTNAELIKSLVLRNDTAENSNEKKSDIDYEGQGKDKILSPAEHWERIEQGLSNNDLWSYICGDNSATRIDLILEINALKRISGNHIYSFEDNDLFDWYENIISSSNDSSKEQKKVIKELDDTFDRVLEWYNDVEIYHIIGLLTKCRELGLTEYKSQQQLLKSIFEKYDDDSVSNKNEFINDLKKTFKDCLLRHINIKDEERGNRNAETIDEVVNGLSYSERPKLVEAFLWALNVWETINATENKQNSVSNTNISSFSISTRLPFSSVVGKKWTIEHIMPQNPKTDTKTADEDAIKTYENLIKDIDGKDDLKVPTGDSVQSISNLALLSKPDNSAISNNSLEIKRRELIDKIGKGSFVPRSTVNVFLLYYNSSNDLNEETSGYNAMYWTVRDSDSYQKQIERCLKEFCNVEG